MASNLFSTNILGQRLVISHVQLSRRVSAVMKVPGGSICVVQEGSFCCYTTYFVMLYRCRWFSWESDAYEAAHKLALQFKYIGSLLVNLGYGNVGHAAWLCSMKLMSWWPMNHPLVCVTRFLQRLGSYTWFTCDLST